jgi:LysM repeat protein
MEQLKQANLNIAGIPGECLMWVREVFGIAAKYPTAISGWENAEYKHAGEQPPAGVDVPVWFTWETSGHVGISTPQGVYSVLKNGVEIKPNVEVLASDIGGTYLGWSEDVDGVRVVQPASSEEFYTVVAGDTLSGIAEKFGITLAQIEALNPQITNPNYIVPGEKVRVK